MDRKCFARMERLLILTLLISGYSEVQRVKWEVNKQIRRLKSKIAICFETRFDGIDEEGGGLRSHGCSYANSKPVTASRARGSPAPYNQRTYQNWYEELEISPWRLPQPPKQYHIHNVWFCSWPHFSFPSNSCQGR